MSDETKEQFSCLRTVLMVSLATISSLLASSKAKSGVHQRRHLGQRRRGADPADREVVVVKIARVLQKWIDQAPVGADEVPRARRKNRMSISSMRRARGPNGAKISMASRGARGRSRTSSTWSTCRPCRSSRIRPARSAAASALANSKMPSR